MTAGIRILECPPCAEYATMQEFFRRRADELGLSRQTIDRLAGFTPGLSAKILAPTPIKRLGHEHIGGFCAALAVAWLPVEDPQALEEIQRRISNGNIEKRNEGKAMHSAQCTPARSRRWMRRIAKKGGENSRKNMPAKRASQLGRLAARARWAKLHAELATSCA